MPSNELLAAGFFLLVIIAAVDIMRRAVSAIVRERRQGELAKAMRKLRRPVQPQVTVLVYARKETDDVATTLRSLGWSRYSNFDVVVVNDTTNKRRYELPRKMNVAVLQRRVAGTKLQAYQAAYRKSQHGSVIVCLDAGDVVDPYFIKRAVALASTKLKWRVAIETTAMKEGVRGVALLLKQLLHNKTTYVQVCQARALKKETVARRQLTVKYWWEAALMTGIIGGYALGPQMLWYVWVVFSGYLLALIWLNGGWRISQKLGYSFAVPSALFVLPVASFLEATFQLGTRK